DWCRRTPVISPGPGGGCTRSTRNVAFASTYVVDPTVDCKASWIVPAPSLGAGAGSAPQAAAPTTAAAQAASNFATFISAPPAREATRAPLTDVLRIRRNRHDAQVEGDLDIDGCPIGQQRSTRIDPRAME